jgi:hypothetical protein
MGMGARRVGLTAAMAVLPWLGAGEARAANGAYDASIVHCSVSVNFQSKPMP